MCVFFVKRTNTERNQSTTFYFCLHDKFVYLVSSLWTKPHIACNATIYLPVNSKLPRYKGEC